MGLPNFFSHLYRSYTLLLGIWYEDSATSWDRDGLVEGSIGAADFRGRLGLDSIRPAQSPKWEEIEGSRPCSCISEEDGQHFQKAGQA